MISHHLYLLMPSPVIFISFLTHPYDPNDSLYAFILILLLFFFTLNYHCFLLVGACQILFNLGISVPIAMVGTQKSLNKRPYFVTPWPKTLIVRVVPGIKLQILCYERTLSIPFYFTLCLTSCLSYLHSSNIKLHVLVYKFRCKDVCLYRTQLSTSLRFKGLK